MEVLEAIKERRSVREFLDKPVSKEDIESLLRAGMSAPSAINKQPWEFYVLESKEPKKQPRMFLFMAVSILLL